MKRYRIMLAIMSLYLLSGCAKKTTSGVSVSKPSVTETNYIPIRGDTVANEKWADLFIKGTQFYLSKDFDLNAAYSFNSRMLGSEGEVIYKDSLIRPLIHYPSRCKCIVTQVMSKNSWKVDCDVQVEGDVPQLDFKSDGRGNYIIDLSTTKMLDWNGQKYSSTENDVYLTMKVEYQKQVTRYKRRATGRSINGTQ